MIARALDVTTNDTPDVNPVHTAIDLPNSRLRSERTPQRNVLAGARAMYHLEAYVRGTTRRSQRCRSQYRFPPRAHVVRLVRTFHQVQLRHREYSNRWPCREKLRELAEYHVPELKGDVVGRQSQATGQSGERAYAFSRQHTSKHTSAADDNLDYRMHSIERALITAAERLALQLPPRRAQQDECKKAT